MTVEEFCAQLARRLAATAEPTGRLEIAAEEIGRFFGVEPHEVGFFSVDTTRNQICFRWPPSVSGTSRVPLKAFDSLVAKTANERQSFLDNAFAASRHLFMFEHLLIEKAERIPVQKVMSVPMAFGEMIGGIVQVVRKGKTLQEAGPDFSSAELSDLECIAATLGGIDL